MNDLLFTFYVPLAIGLTEVFKRTFASFERFTPLVALICGILLAMTGGVTTDNLLTGLVIGLSANGLYSGTKAVFEAKPVEPVSETNLTDNTSV
jgi:hypothetical protein